MLRRKCKSQRNYRFVTKCHLNFNFSLFHLNFSNFYKILLQLLLLGVIYEPPKVPRSSKLKKKLGIVIKKRKITLDA